ncbi:hypothetical protein IWQ61_004064 [Dispira simplex]|nr:hypothetical protein IWQ61_004064 [Dispira simplex]
MLYSSLLYAIPHSSLLITGAYSSTSSNGYLQYVINNTTGLPGGHLLSLITRLQNIKMYIEVVKLMYVLIETQLSERNQISQNDVPGSHHQQSLKKPHLQSAFSESTFDAKQSDTVLGTQNLVPPVLTTIESPLGVSDQVTPESSNTVQADIVTVV